MRARAALGPSMTVTAGIPSGTFKQPIQFSCHALPNATIRRSDEHHNEDSPLESYLCSRRLQPELQDSQSLKPQAVRRVGLSKGLDVVSSVAYFHFRFSWLDLPITIQPEYTVETLGWGDVHLYATQILPRSLEGEIILQRRRNSHNPFAAVLEPDLNPHPLWSAPLVFFFLKPFTTLLIVACTLFGLVLRNKDKDS
jgi:hypothetical protein